MLTTDQLRALIAARESDGVELTVSTANTDKFGEAVCAFANDFPNHGQPGHLIVGVRDDGTVSGLTVTDGLLRRLGELRSNVNIEPLPVIQPGRDHRGELRRLSPGPRPVLPPGAPQRRTDAPRVARRLAGSPGAPSGGSGLSLPSADIVPAGYIVMQHAVRAGRPVQAYQKWIKRIPDVYRRQVASDLHGGGSSTTEDDTQCLATH